MFECVVLDIVNFLAYMIGDNIIKNKLSNNNNIVNKYLTYINIPVIERLIYLLNVKLRLSKNVSTRYLQIHSG